MARILIADDHRDTADTMCEYFVSHGYQAQTAYDGLSALEAIYAFDPAVVFLDLSMPQMTGLQVAVALRSQPNGRQTFLVAVSGDTGVDLSERVEQAGFNHHFAKPADLASLLLLAETAVQWQLATKLIANDRGRHPNPGTDEAPPLRWQMPTG